MFEASDLEPILLFAIFVPLVLLYIASLIDLLRREDLSVVRKALWVAAIILTAYIGVALYYIMRPPGEPEGKESGDASARSKSVVDQLEELRAAHDKGDLDDQAFLEAKRRTLGLTSEPADH